MVFHRRRHFIKISAQLADLISCTDVAPDGVVPSGHGPGDLCQRFYGPGEKHGNKKHEDAAHSHGNDHDHTVKADLPPHTVVDFGNIFHIYNINLAVFNTQNAGAPEPVCTSVFLDGIGFLPFFPGKG